MSIFPQWSQFAVHQRRPESGSVPTGYEMMLRAAGIEGIDFETFQDEFDLDKDAAPETDPKNNFKTVSGAIRKKHPHVRFKIVGFAPGEGHEKLAVLEEQISNQRLVLVNLYWENDKWQIIPLVDATRDELVFLNWIDSNGRVSIHRMTKKAYVRLHDQVQGGHHIVYLDMN